MTTRLSQFSWRTWLVSLLSFLFLLPQASRADDLGEFLLREIKANPQAVHSDAVLLLLSRDLGWYEKHMGELPQGIQDQVQNLRIRVVGESTRAAAEAMGEPADIFLASGSCKPGRDIDLLYVGRDTRRARQAIDTAIAGTTAGVLSRGGGDPLLQAARTKGLTVPGSLSSSAMDVVASDLPNFGYKDLDDALAKARAVQKSGSGDAGEVLRKEMHEALKRNLDAQVASSAKDMYRGGAGQRFFVTSYLGDPQKVRRIAFENGAWTLQPGGREALSGLLLEQVNALVPSSRRAKFAKVASDYAMFFKHGEGGIGGTAKYVERIWGDVDELALLVHMDEDEGKALITAMDIAQRPSAASSILAYAEVSEAQVVERVRRGLYQSVENQLLLDVNVLITELENIDAAKGAKAIDDLEALYQKQLLKFDLNDLANGLTAISDVPGVQPEAVLKTLQREFGDRVPGPGVLAYIERQLRLMTGESANQISLRLLKTLLDSQEITAQDYYDLNRQIQTGVEAPSGSAANKLKQARQELLYLSSVDMLDLDGGPNSIDAVVEEWRRQRGGALIRSVPDEIRKTVDELATLSSGDLKALGWLEAEIRLPMETRLRIKLLPEQMADMADRLQDRLGKQAVSLVEWQRKTRQYIFSQTPTELGNPGDMLAMDAVFAVASGLYQTYSILNSSPPMKPEEENLALANAWVTSLPIVGDFANGIISGIDAAFSGDKRKALEAGLYVTIGIMGVVPGGQIPAVIAGLVMVGTPLAEGVYDARQAQNLVQAWIDSGDWDDANGRPPSLKGLFDRDGTPHALTYEELLTDKGDVPYRSERADGLFTVPTINASIRDYAEKYVFPQYPRIKELRESLKLLFPNFNDRDWEDEFDAKSKVQALGGKAALLFFAEYRLLRTQALNQTIAHLKTWAEEEFRVGRDYEGEVGAIREELRALEAELKVNSLVAHADQSAQAYAKVIKNALEQETLPLSRYRIYRHYLHEYRQIAALHRKITQRLAEVPDGYRPGHWHLTGYPEFDRPRIVKLAAMIENGRAHAVDQIEKLTADFGFSARGGYDPGNPCQKKALQILLAHRYKISFIENLVEYFTTLAEAESAWSDAYATARSRYIEVRDSFADISAVGEGDAAAGALTEAVVAFVAAMPYALASGERELYRDTASEFRIKMDQAMRDYEHAGFHSGEAGSALEECLLKSLKVEISLSPMVPAKGTATRARASLAAGIPPSDSYWRWVADGELVLDSRHGEEVQVTVNGPGTLTVHLMDDFRDRAKLLVQASMRVVPAREEEKEDGTGGQEPAPAVREPSREGSAPEAPAPPPATAKAADEGTWFKSSLAGGWQVEHNRASHWTAKMIREIAPKSKDCRPQTVHGSIGAKVETSFLPKPGEIDAKLRAHVESNGWYPDEEGIQAFSIGKYKGRMLTTTIKYKAGFGNPMAGYRDGTAHSFGYVIALHETERRMITASFSVYAGSCWDNSGKANALAQVTAAKAQAIGILSGLSLHETEQQSPVTAGEPVAEPVQAEEKKDKKFTLVLNRVSPASGPVVVGTPVIYKAVLSGDEPEGEVRYQFEPHPDVAFTPHEGPSASTTAVFSVPGTVGVWVTAVDKTGTIATSDQLEIEIQKPVLELAMEPKAPLVGQEVRARLTVKPEVKDIDLRWMPVPGNAKHISTSKDNRELVFYLKDEKPAEIQVKARVPFSGEDLGEAKASAAAKKYAVTVSAPKAQGPPPRVWKEGVGLVTVDKAIAVDQIVEFSVVVQPEALSGPVKYRWKVENGPCRVSNPSSSVARVTANAAGTCELSVTVRDRNDVELGVGQGSFSASVTQEAIRQGESKAQSGGEAQKLVQNAPAKARKGDYDGAIKDAEEAARLDPGNTAAKALSDRLRQEKDRIHAQLEKTRGFMEQRRYNEAQKELTVAKNLNGYYPPIHETEETLRKHWNAWNQEAAQKNHEIRSAIEKKEFGKALDIAAAWRASTVIAPTAEGELKQNETRARKWQTQKKVQVELLREAGEMVGKHDYAGALKRFEQGFLNWNNVFSGSEPEYREARELQSRAANAAKRLGEIVPLLEAVVGIKTRSPADIERGTLLAEEAVALQPNNRQYAQWRDMLRGEAAGTASAQGGPAGSASGEQAARELWKEAEKLQLEQDYSGALQKYREGLKLHADPAVENRVRTLEKYVTVSKGAQSPAPGKSAPAPPAASHVNMLGEWSHVGNGHTTTLIVSRQDGNAFSGVMHGNPLINGVVDGNTVTFTRDIPQRQDYAGTLTVRPDGAMAMSGTFTQKGAPGSYRWSSSKPAPGGGAGAVDGQGSAPVPPTSTGSRNEGATAVPSGWKAVTIGNVSFAVPASWSHKTMEEPDLETFNLSWDGSFDDPRHGVSGGVTPDYARAKSDLSGPRTVTLGGAEVLRVDDGPAMNLLFPPMGGNRGVALVVFRGPGGSQATIDAVLKTFRVGGQTGPGAGSAVPGDGKALTTGRQHGGGTRWENASDPTHYLEREITGQGVRWVEYSKGKAVFRFEEKGGSNIHGSVTIYDPARNITGVLSPDRFEFSRDGRTLGTHSGGWK